WRVAGRRPLATVARADEEVLEDRRVIDYIGRRDRDAFRPHPKAAVIVLLYVIIIDSAVGGAKGDAPGTRESPVVCGDRGIRRGCITDLAIAIAAGCIDC